MKFRADIQVFYEVEDGALQDADGNDLTAGQIAAIDQEAWEAGLIGPEDVLSWVEDQDPPVKMIISALI